jgi:hypothetical protein
MRRVSGSRMVLPRHTQFVTGWDLDAHTGQHPERWGDIKDPPLLMPSVFLAIPLCQPIAHVSYRLTLVE